MGLHDGKIPMHGKGGKHHGFVAGLDNVRAAGDAVAKALPKAGTVRSYELDDNGTTGKFYGLDVRDTEYKTNGGKKGYVSQERSKGQYGDKKWHPSPSTGKKQ